MNAIAVGDRFQITMTVTAERDGDYELRPEGWGTYCVYVKPDLLLKTGLRLHRIAKVGDRVLVPHSDYADHIVVHVDAGMAWCRDDNGKSDLFDIEDLIPEEPA